jgi:aspartate aminotransferase
MEVMERAEALKAEGRDIILLCLGEPDFSTPVPVVESACAAMRNGHTSYTHSLGRIELREAITDHYRSRYGVVITPDEVIISSGTSPLMLLLFASLLDPGDEIILPDPSYACYLNFTRFLAGRTVFLQTREEDGFQPRPSEVQKLIGPKTRGVMLNSPSNPAGSVLPASWLEELTRLPVPLISDEIYHGLTYQGGGAERSRVYVRCFCPGRIFENLCHDRSAPGLSDCAAGLCEHPAVPASEFPDLCQQFRPGCRSDGVAGM